MHSQVVTGDWQYKLYADFDVLALTALTSFLSFSRSFSSSASLYSRSRSAMVCKQISKSLCRCRSQLLQMWQLELGEAAGHHQSCCIPLVQTWRQTLASKAADHSLRPRCQSRTRFHPGKAAVSKMQGSHTDAMLSTKSGKRNMLSSSVAPLLHH